MGSFCILEINTHTARLCIQIGIILFSLKGASCSTGLGTLYRPYSTVNVKSIRIQSVIQSLHTRNAALFLSVSTGESRLIRTNNTKWNTLIQVSFEFSEQFNKDTIYPYSDWRWPPVPSLIEPATTPPNNSNKTGFCLHNASRSAQFERMQSLTESAEKKNNRFKFGRDECTLWSRRKRERLILRKLWLIQLGRQFWICSSSLPTIWICSMWVERTNGAVFVVWVWSI